MGLNSVQLRVSDLIYAIKKRIPLIIIFTVIGLGIGFLMSGASYLQGQMTRNYEIKASAVLITAGGSGKFAAQADQPTYNDFKMAGEMTDTVRYILKSEKTLGTVVSKLGFRGVTSRDIRNNLTISKYEETPVIELTLTWRDSEEGVRILNTILDVSSKTLQETLKTGSISPIDEPSSRYIVGGSINASTWGIMMVIGFMLGVGLVALDVLVRPTLINLSDVKTDFGIETLATIPKDTQYFNNLPQNILEADHTTSEIDRNFSSASYIIRNRLNNKSKCGRFYVTSASRGEGKTTVAANLALQFAEKECKVLLVDFDTKNPTLGSLFMKEVDYQHSLNALYRGDIDEHEAVTSLNGFLDILPVVLEHTSIPLDGMVIDLIERLSENYQYVIMDAPPVEFSDTLSLNRIADVLLVIGFDMAQKSDIHSAIEKLDKSGTRIIGCIVNQEQTDGFQFTTKEKKKKPSKELKQKKKNEENSLKEMTTSKNKKEVKEKIKENDTPTQRNLFEELSASNEDVLTDEEAVAALFEIGIKGDIDTESDSDSERS